jgi:hypothetical protein
MMGAGRFKGDLDWLVGPSLERRGQWCNEPGSAAPSVDPRCPQPSCTATAWRRVPSSGGHQDQPDRLDVRSEPALDAGLAISACGPSVRSLPAASAQLDPLQIAVLARPWIVVATGYGGVGAIVDFAVRGARCCGNEVTLFGHCPVNCQCGVRPWVR